MVNEIKDLPKTPHERVDRRSIGKMLQDNGPQNPHEEIMLCIESTNEIVSEHTERLNAIAELLKLILAKNPVSTLTVG